MSLSRQYLGCLVCGKLQHFEAVQGADYFTKMFHMFIFALKLPLPTHISGGNHYSSDSWEIIYYALT